MLYLESYKIMMYKKHPEIVEAFDYYLGTSVGEVTNRISASVMADKMDINVAMAKQLLLDYEREKVLKKRYIVTCPNEGCDNIIFISDEENLIEKMEEYNYCDECDDYNLKFSSENIYVVFERVKTPTACQREIEETLYKNRDIDKNYINELNFFDGADSLDCKQVYEVFFHPEESAKERWRTYCDKLNIRAQNTIEKGNILEKLVEDIFNEVQGFEVRRNYRTKTNQLDVTVLPKLSLAMPTVFRYLEPYFICECKNEKTKSGNTYYHKLASILEGTAGKVGILFSVKSCRKTCEIIAREKYLTHNIILINLTQKDMSQVIADNVNIFELIQAKINAVTISSEIPIKNLGLE